MERRCTEDGEDVFEEDTGRGKVWVLAEGLAEGAAEGGVFLGGLGLGLVDWV